MLEDIIKERLKTRKPEYYPARVKRTHLISDAVKNFGSLAKQKKTIWITGRIMGLRTQGGLMFWDVQDGGGPSTRLGTNKIQAVVKKDNLANFSELKNNINLGDFVGVAGPLFKTQSGEKSLEVKNAQIIVKSLRPLPSVWHGLKDVEERFRKRYLDILLNPEVKEKIIQRSQIVEYLRTALIQEGFLEVETPILQPIPGGAKARPFVTHYNALDADFYLRIAPELYLKRLLVSGFEKIFEIGRNFRNEGLDRDHNPEFTMLELYWAYQDYKSLLKFIEKILKNFISAKWEKTTFASIFKKHSGRDYKSVKPAELDEVFNHKIRPKIIKPTVILDYPESVMPLAKLKTDDPALTESFQLIVNGAEIVKGFSELNDPVIQRQQMERQEKNFRADNEVFSRLDKDFLEALEYGMPPAAGLGIGIDRLAALAAHTHSVKEIIIFPTLRPK